VVVCAVIPPVVTFDPRAAVVTFAVVVGFIVEPPMTDGLPFLIVFI